MFAVPATAQEICDNRKKILRHLEQNYGETPKALGFAATGGRIVELFTSDTGSWTLIISAPIGISCLMANGENWQPAPSPNPDPGI